MQSKIELACMRKQIVTYRKNKSFKLTVKRKVSKW